MTAWPVISQNAPDSVKVARPDLISAAEELEAFDLLKAETALRVKILETYQRENEALRIQNQAKAGQITLLNKAYKILETENEANKAKSSPKFTLIDALLIALSFLGGAFVTTL